MADRAEEVYHILLDRLLGYSDHESEETLALAHTIAYALMGVDSCQNVLKKLIRDMLPHTTDDEMPLMGALLEIERAMADQR